MDYMLSINYSMINSGIQVLNSLVIENNDTKDWHQLIIQINGHYIKDRSCRLEILKTGQSVQVNSIKIEPDFKILSEIQRLYSTVDR